MENIIIDDKLCFAPLSGAWALQICIFFFFWIFAFLVTTLLRCWSSVFLCINSQTMLWFARTDICDAYNMHEHVSTEMWWYSFLILSFLLLLLSKLPLFFFFLVSSSHFVLTHSRSSRSVSVALWSADYSNASHLNAFSRPPSECWNAFVHILACAYQNVSYNFVNIIFLYRWKSPMKQKKV